MRFPANERCPLALLGYPRAGSNAQQEALLVPGSPPHRVSRTSLFLSLLLLLLASQCEVDYSANNYIVLFVWITKFWPRENDAGCSSFRSPFRTSVSLFFSVPVNPAACQTIRLPSAIARSKLKTGLEVLPAPLFPLSVFNPSLCLLDNRYSEGLLIATVNHGCGGLDKPCLTWPRKCQD